MLRGVYSTFPDIVMVAKTKLRKLLLKLANDDKKKPFTEEVRAIIPIDAKLLHVCGEEDSGAPCENQVYRNYAKRRVTRGNPMNGVKSRGVENSNFDVHLRRNTNDTEQQLLN